MVGIVEVRKLFFDSDMVLRKLDAKSRKVLSKGGAFIRRTARSSIKKSKQKSVADLTAKEARIYAIRVADAKKHGRPKPKRPFAASKPGEPPRSPTGKYKQTIFFYYDEQSNSMVCGPVKLARSQEKIPAILESGGTETVNSGRTVTIRPRPHMAPAYEKERSKIVAMFAGDL